MFYLAILYPYPYQVKLLYFNRITMIYSEVCVSVLMILLNFLIQFRHSADNVATATGVPQRQVPLHTYHG